MDLKPGQRWKSQVSEAEVVVIKGSGDRDLTCAGVSLVPQGAGAADPVPAGTVPEGSTLLGKRYTDPDETIELLCTKPGAGALAVDGRPLALKSAKALPSSD